MVGKYLAEFQREMSLAEAMRECLAMPCPMRYGYPARVWCPRHLCPCQAKPFVPDAAAKQSNGVPRILRLCLSRGYVLGLYNPVVTKDRG